MIYNVLKLMGFQSLTDEEKLFGVREFSFYCQAFLLH